MPEASFMILATLAAQTAAGLLMAALLVSFKSYYDKHYLVHWAWSWLLLGVAMACTASVYLLVAPGAEPLSRAFISAIATVTAYLWTGFLLLGSFEMAFRRRVKQRIRNLSIAALVFAGIATVWTFPGISSQASLRYSFRFGVRSTVIALLLLYGAIWLLRGSREKRGVAFGILRTSFALLAIEHIQHAVLSFIYLETGTLYRYAAYLGFADFAFQAGIALGMVACLLEDEREAAALATDEIEHLAYHDALTGLPNRSLFIDRLIVAIAQAQRYNQKLAVLFLDVDRFKEVNDSLGHSVGDTLLKGLAERVRHATRQGDTVARFGGDEFTLLVHKLDLPEDAAKVAQNITNVLKIPFDIGGRELFATASIGISIYPSDGLDADTLVRNADTAMYRAKEQGRDNYQLYAPTMNARALERLALENLLRKALSHEELVLFYQPLVDAETKEIVAVEALIRWNHPQLGLLSPAHFITAAEVSGLIVPIGDWVLRSACRQTRKWQQELGFEIDLSVNLSPRQFQQPDLVAQVKGALADSGLAASSLELEITESGAMQNPEAAIQTLIELKNLGVRIAMDDFGTGYSSLSYLKRFPIDTLKLDQSFVRNVTVDEEDAAIAAAVISMAHTMELMVVAEGVETEAQLEFLRSRGCDRIQGYLYSAPISAADLARFLHQYKKTGRETVA